jgi:hypothetical protein
MNEIVTTYAGNTPIAVEISTIGRSIPKILKKQDYSLAYKNV